MSDWVTLATVRSFNNVAAPVPHICSRSSMPRHPIRLLQMLTLASNERIPLTSSMRLLLEINHMNHCSPATVSRGGVIFVNADDIGWKPAVESWVERLECADYRPLLSMLFR